VSITGFSIGTSGCEFWGSSPEGDAVSSAKLCTGKIFAAGPELFGDSVNP
jgi:hypothetical protein